ncbi:MAG TPA: hypothetical protein V6D07_05250 [Trichocoleus sp.]
MKSAVAPSLGEALQEAIKLAQTVEQHSEAQAVFERLHQELQGQHSPAADLLAVLWREYLRSQRSTLFWQELCQVEKHLSEQLSESHLQLKQNYLRLIQEQ